MTDGCIRFLDSYRFLSCALNSLVKTVVDNCHKTLKNVKEENVDKDEILNFFKGIGEEHRTIEDLKKDYPEKNRNLEEALLNYMGENNLQILKTEVPDKWNFLTKKLDTLSIR